MHFEYQQWPCVYLLRLVLDLTELSNMVTGKGFTPQTLTPELKDQIKQGIPDWETLFGQFDLCQCEHCRSVLSPAAYLVDILAWLEERKSITPGKSAKDVLFSRRPDLGEIELTCDNTNTPLPYVDLVNEVPENAISPPIFSIGPINQNWINQLDTETLPPEFIGKFAETRFPLQKTPIVSGLITGKKWVIMGEGYRYVLDKNPNGIDVHFFPQTSWTAEELTANPEHINIKAYDLLSSEVYPWQLPFDLWTEEIRTYLEHLGIRRFKLIQTFPTENLSSDIQQRNVSIAGEYLGLYKKELEIIKGIAKEENWEFWGYEMEFPNGIKWVNHLRSVNILMDKTSLTYQELGELLKLKFIDHNSQ